MWKGPEVGEKWAYLRNRKKASVIRVGVMSEGE